MPVMYAPCWDSESLLATHKSRTLQNKRVRGLETRKEWRQRMKLGERKRMLDGYWESESGFLFFHSPHCGHVYRVRLIILYPEMWQDNAAALKACVWMWKRMFCICVSLLGCACFNFQPRISLRVACVCHFHNHLVACVRVSPHLSVCERRGQLVFPTAGIYDTFCFVYHCASCGCGQSS